MKKILTSIAIMLIALSTLTTSTFAVGNPRATGDLVGRNLRISGLGEIGHVGIWDNSRKQVLEVLNRRNYAITTETLYQFKRASTRYWGARYGRGWSHYRVINAGRAQRYFNPSYTTSPYIREGRYKRVWRCSWRGCRRVTIKINAKFRSDTFVSYSYTKGIGLSLLSWYKGMSPRNIFYSMPYSR